MKHLWRWKPTPVVTFSFVSLLITVIIAVVMDIYIQQELERLALLQAAEGAAGQVDLFLDSNLNAVDLAGPLDPARYQELEILMDQILNDPHIVRVKIWNRDGLLIYSDEKELVGRHFPMEEDLQQALDGQITMSVSSLDKAENVLEKGRFGSQLLETYVPLRIHDSPQISGAYEIYRDLAAVGPRIAATRTFVRGIIALGFSFLYGVLVILVYGVSHELARRNNENARLYEETKQRLAERKQAEEALQKSEKMLEQRVEERTREIQRQRQVAEGLRDILTVLNSKRALDETLDYIVDQATKLLGIAAGAIYLQGEDGLLRIRASRGIDPEVIVLKIPVGVLPMGEAAQKGQPVVVSDSNNAVLDLSKAELVLSPYEQAALKSMFLRYPACLAVPLIAKDEIYGAIVLFYYEPQVFSDETIRLTMVFGDQAALAIENARLFAEAEGKAVIEERQRLARDLHDSVSQSLYSLSLLAEAGRRVSDAGDQNSARHYLSRLGETALQSLKDMRLLVYELRPLTLNAEGLAGALQHRLDAVEKRAGMKVSLISNGVINLPATVETELFRVALEALNNTLKHAMATEVVVALRVEYGCVELEVVDNGRGFEPDALSDSGGLGLLSMRERAEKLGGSLMVIASPGNGTRIRVRIGL
jgi:signal transduction histidine kinase/PAS domain-containing protein